MAYVPMNRTRALIICTRPQDYAPARLREAARCLLDRRDAADEEKRLASEAIEGLRSKRGEVHDDNAVTTQTKQTQPSAPKRKGSARSGRN